MKFVRKVRRRPFINIIPLIDILVVLLIFYIATTVFKKNQPKINITVPPSVTATASKDTTPSIIYITADGKFFLDDQAVEPDELGKLLKEKKDADPKFTAAIKADTKAPVGMFVKVYDAAHQAGMPELQMFMSTPAAGSGSPSP